MPRKENNPITTCVYENGSPVPTNHCIVPSNFTETFVIKVRSLHGIHRNVIAELIQQKYELVEIDHTDRHIVCRGGPR